MSISTGPVIPMILQSYLHYIIDDSNQGSTVHIINLNTVELRSLRSWTKVDSILSDSHFAEHLSKSRAHMVCSECAIWWRRKMFVARIFKIQVWRATWAPKYGCPTVISGNSGQSGKDLLFLHNQLHSCWWPSTLHPQGISWHGIDA